jgi:hypothetical protein
MAVIIAQNIPGVQPLAGKERERIFPLFGHTITGTALPKDVAD